MALLLFTRVAPLFAAQATIATLVQPQPRSAVAGPSRAGHSVEATHNGSVVTNSHTQVKVASTSKAPSASLTHAAPQERTTLQPHSERPAIHSVSAEQANLLAKHSRVLRPDGSELDVVSDIVSQFKPKTPVTLQAPKQTSQGSQTKRSKTQSSQKSEISKPKVQATQSSKEPMPKVQPTQGSANSKPKVGTAKDINSPKQEVPATQGSVATKSNVEITQDIKSPKLEVQPTQGSMALNAAQRRVRPAQVAQDQGGTSLNPEAQVGPAHVTQDSVDPADRMNNFLDESGSNDAEQLELPNN